MIATHYLCAPNFNIRSKGQIIERSNKRATVFIEPEAAIRLNDRLIMAKAEETAEEYQILAGLTGLLAENLTEILPVWMYWLNWTSSLLEQNTVVKFMVFR